MKTVSLGDRETTSRNKYTGEWQCPRCATIVEIEESDTVRPGWTEGTIEVICPLCRTREEFRRERGNDFPVLPVLDAVFSLTVIGGVGGVIVWIVIEWIRGAM